MHYNQINIYKTNTHALQQKNHTYKQIHMHYNRKTYIKQIHMHYTEKTYPCITAEKHT